MMFYQQEDGFDAPTITEHSAFGSNDATEATPNANLPAGFGGARSVDAETAAVTAELQGDGKAGSSTIGKRRRWYIIHTYSGHENKVKINLERRAESMNMGHKIFRVEVPQKAVTRIKDGKRVEKEERVFPGYVLVEMILDDDSWYVVRYTPGVTKFIGGEKKPIAAKDSEIKRILMRMQPAAGMQQMPGLASAGAPMAEGGTPQAPAAPKIEIDIKVGDSVLIISGPFADFEGVVTEINLERERLKANVSIFGRETPVELAFSQVQKVG
ncbi:MAG: transcription termination/antitermination protein NusG [Vampirovibrionales bacterium]|nr:transcription termination/antitermination protein NusG [Vampirovibrionales bacterium]